MGKMTQEKKKRREKRLNERKQEEKLLESIEFDLVENFFDSLEEGDFEFKKSNETLRYLLDKYPDPDDAPQEVKELVSISMNKVFSTILAQPIQNADKNLIEY